MYLQSQSPAKSTAFPSKGNGLGPGILLTICPNLENLNRKYHLAVNALNNSARNMKINMIGSNILRIKLKMIDYGLEDTTKETVAFASVVRSSLNEYLSAFLTDSYRSSSRR